MALPAVLGIGRRADNPSLLPLDYGRNLAAVLAVIALAAACAVVVSRLRTRPRERTRLLLGAVAGLAGGLIIGSLMAYQGMVGPTGWASFVVHAVILGAVLGAVAGQRARDLATAFSCGILVGLLDWAVWHLTLRPLLAGEIPTWTITSGDRSFHVLVGNVLLGGITGALLYGALTAHRLAATRSAPAAPIAPVAPPRVVIVGGGFGGVSTARRLDRHAARGLRAEVTLISDTNALLFTPMLAGVASSALEPRHVSAPVRAALSHTAFLHGHVDAIDTVRRVVHVTTGEEGMAAVPYEHLVLAVGSVPHYFDLPGLAEHAFALKTVGDATRLRNHVLGALEDADLEPDPVRRAQLLTVVVAGGGFAGTELVAELFDLVHGVLHQYPNIRDCEPRFVLVHAGEGILPELSAELGAYALEKLRGRGIEFHLKARVAEASPGAVRLSDGQTIPTRTLAWTAGNRRAPSRRGAARRARPRRVRRRGPVPAGHRDRRPVGDRRLRAHPRHRRPALPSDRATRAARRADGRGQHRRRTPWPPARGVPLPGPRHPGGAGPPNRRGRDPRPPAVRAARLDHVAGDLPGQASRRGEEGARPGRLVDRPGLPPRHHPHPLPVSLPPRHDTRTPRPLR